ncbi:MAG TPA: endonuclease/exonuclease/phosphatase family protein [Kiritimatiellia bacterium]|nr:endonuclease/exonuclease/phosphatase family protein [Kiritimatiellia bacterium]
MRFLLYNIRYATAARKPRFPWSGYFGRTEDHLGEITRFIKSLQPDIVGLVEVDGGSYRASKKNQAETIAEALGHYHTYRSKYSETARMANFLPVLNKQGNAFLARDTVRGERFHYFQKGMKRLVIELELDRFVIYLVHLSLGFRVRHHQLRDLYDLVRNTEKPVIVAGDFNALWGETEVDLFLAASGLRNVNTEKLPSFPSWAPKRHLDFILCSPEIELKNFWMPRVTLSDHLPLVIDFDVAR